MHHYAISLICVSNFSLLSKSYFSKSFLISSFSHIRVAADLAVFFFCSAPLPVADMVGTCPYFALITPNSSSDESEEISTTSPASNGSILTSCLMAVVGFGLGPPCTGPRRFRNS